MFALVPSTHPALRTRSRPVTPDEIPELRRQLYWLQKLMKKEGGVGLAANQIGDCRQYFVWDVGMVINPEIVSCQGPLVDFEEACLSFPGMRRIVTRHYSISVRFIDERGILNSRGYDGFTARIFQHEYEHLLGVTIENREAPERTAAS